MSENHSRFHFRSIRKFDFFFTKWPPASILDDQKSRSIAFLAISDQYAIFSRRPFWMIKIHVWSHFFSIFQINTQLFFFHKMAAGFHFGWSMVAGWSLTSLCHSNGHIETMPARENNPFIALTRIRSQFLRTQWSTSNHQRVNTTALQTAQPSGWLLDDRKSLSIAFLSISDQYATLIFLENGSRRPFWMTENHFRWYFSPFQINTQLFFDFFFTKWWPASILDDWNHFRSHFSPFQINK